jgi:hypothetical protein
LIEDGLLFGPEHFEADGHLGSGIVERLDHGALRHVVLGAAVTLADEHDTRLPQVRDQFREADLRPVLDPENDLGGRGGCGGQQLDERQSRENGSPALFPLPRYRRHGCKPPPREARPIDTVHLPAGEKRGQASRCRRMSGDSPEAGPAPPAFW